MTPEEILSRLPDAVVVIDQDEQIVEWSGAAQKLFGWDRHEILGKTVNDTLRPRDLNGGEAQPLSARGGEAQPLSAKRRSGESLQASVVTGAGSEREFMFSAKDGSSVPVGVTVSASRSTGEGRATVIAVCRDIADRRRVDLAKSEVVSAVSHELRSPLTSIKGFASTLINRWDRFDDDTKKQLLGTINTDADRVTRLIGELLDVGHLEQGRLRLRTRPMNFKTVADRVVQRLQSTDDSHQFKLDLPEEFPEVIADSDKVEQILTNLLENALKYTDRGPVVLAGVWEPPFVRLSVSDQGDGIPPDDRVSVFDKFFRRSDHNTANQAGTGLGLYISKGLVEAHGGSIWVEDGPGGGASFVFTLPTSKA